ncbi:MULTISPECIES: hypothetical protein [unclassified Okeania]|nr:MULTISPECIES: hypothetical protein [unclassified Okeania]
MIITHCYKIKPTTEQSVKIDYIKSGSIGVIKPEFSATNGTGL